MNKTSLKNLKSGDSYLSKTILASALLLASASVAQAAPANTTGSFDMYANEGLDQSVCTHTTCGSFVNTDSTVTGFVDMAAGTWGVSSTATFFGFNWTASNGQLITTAGDYALDTASGTVSAATPDATGTSDSSIHFTIGANQIAGTIDFAWNTTTGIRVVNVWNVAADGTMTAVTVPGMENGPFPAYNAGFSMTPGNKFPVAVDDSATHSPGTTTPITIDLFANDYDAEDSSNAPPLPTTETITLDTSLLAAGSSVVDNGNGTVTYTPSGSLVAGNTDTFKYTVTDSGGATSLQQATVTVTILNNTAPVANNVTFNGTEDTAQTIGINDTPASGGSTIATDADAGQTLTFASVVSPTANGGTVTLNGAKTALTYTPAANFNGTDTFSYTVTDSYANSNTATMTISVAAVNDAPVCSDVSLGTAADTALTISVATDLLATCSDVDTGDVVTLDSVAQPAQSGAGATLANDGAGTLTYTPPSGYTGNDSFTFTATDSHGGFVTATVNVKVGALQSNFTMLDKTGKVFGGTNDVDMIWDGSYNTSETDVDFTHMTIATSGPTPFFGSVWHAHNVQVFGPGTYYFETDNSKCESKKNYDPAYTKTYHASASDIEVSGCPGTPGGATTMVLTVGAGQVGAHMLFDYNSNFDIDVVNVWNVNSVWNDPTGQGDGINDLWTGAGGVPPSPTGTWALVSADANGDGINGSPMVDGPFVGFYANFNKDPGGSGTTPVISAVAPIALNHNFLGSFSWQTLLLVPAGLLMFRRRRMH